MSGACIPIDEDMSASLEETFDQHAWTFENQPVTQLCVHRTSCSLESWTLQALLEIRLSAPFRLSLPDGTSRAIDPEASEQVAPLLTLIGRAVTYLTVTRAGSLEVGFGDGSVLSTESHLRHEAFQVNGGGALEGLQYLARPGGGVPWAG